MPEGPGSRSYFGRGHNGSGRPAALSLVRFGAVCLLGLLQCGVHWWHSTAAGLCLWQICMGSIDASQTLRLDELNVIMQHSHYSAVLIPE
jgi:hypothetical protein